MPTWWNYRPPHRSDIRIHVSGGPSDHALQHEREIRARILATSPELKHRRLAEKLRAAEPGVPVDLGCCPVNARMFQIYAAAQILEALRNVPRLRMLTVADAGDAVSAEDLPAIDWRRRHNRLRRRLERSVSPHAIAIGIGELDFDTATSTFRPHHHVFIGNCTRNELEELRRHYPSIAGAGAPMRVDAVSDLARQLSYSLKLTVLRKPFLRTGVTRPPGYRLLPDDFRRHMAYLAHLDLRQLLFGFNARIDGR